MDLWGAEERHVMGDLPTIKIPAVLTSINV